LDIIEFFKEAWCFGRWLGFCLQAKKHVTSGPLDHAILSLGTVETVYMLRHAPENRSSPRAETGKWLMKN
jgi:hypothetical protein